MEIKNIISDFVFGLIFLYLGINMIFKRSIIVNALIASNSIFWEKLNFTVNNKIAVLVTNIMIPFIGIVFSLSGIAYFYKIIYYLLK